MSAAALPRLSPGNLLAPLLGGCLAAALLALAVPRLMATTALLKGDAALELLQSGQEPTLEGIERLLRSRQEALAWVPDARSHFDLAGAFLALSEANVRGSVTPEELRALAERHLRAGLSLAPADARAWQLLATAKLLQNDPDEAARALVLSFKANPHAPYLGNARTTLGMLLWGRLDETTQARLRKEMYSTFRQNPSRTAQIALDTGGVTLLQDALKEHEQDQARLQRLLQKLRPAEN
ncbi:hypothetical protein [Benzoatithermus flavus]|uniref:Uncharacterized protein n=1 Tax=Benzoatithermus flavus TaxID=3108223 RepID=A0ABU8XNZ1_9PROT